jgi:hypothetical protein
VSSLSLSVSLCSFLSTSPPSQNLQFSKQKNVDTQHILRIFMCPRCLSLYQLPLKGFRKRPQFSEAILTYLIPIVRFELAASMRIWSPPSSSSSPASSEKWKSDQIIILRKKNCPFPLQLPVQIVAARARSPSSAFGDSQRSCQYATTTQNGFWKGEVSRDGSGPPRTANMCAIKQRTRPGAIEASIGRILPFSHNRSGRLSKRIWKIEPSGYQFHW